MIKKLFSLTAALLLCIIPVSAIVDGRSMTQTLKDLHAELQVPYVQMEHAHQQFNEDYMKERQHLLEVITESNQLSILLYTQEQGMTFDMSYALKKVVREYENFNNTKLPFDRVIGSIDFEIDRYARLIEALRRLPPVKKASEVVLVPDSLKYRNDSLDLHMSKLTSSLEKEIIRISTADTSVAPVLLDEEGQLYRDSCIIYASELLNMCADHRATIMNDSAHYQAAYIRIKEAYDYAESRYTELEQYVFVDGQTPFMVILTNFKAYWEVVKEELKGQYDFTEFGESSDLDTLSSKGTNTFLFMVCVIQLIALGIFWVIVAGILWLIWRFIKPKYFVERQHLPLFSVLVGTILYILILGYLWHGDEYVMMGVHHINTFLFLLIAISASMLLRVSSSQIRNDILLYSPAFMIALVIIVFRNSFIPDSAMVLLFPPILLLIVLRQLFFCIKEQKKVPAIDSSLGWISLIVYSVAFFFSFRGFTFASLLILIWWYFQLAVLLMVICISDLLSRYKEKRLNKRIKAMRERITYVTGDDRESLLFGATWLYDLVKSVLLPSLVIVSLPFCAHLSLNIFDFNDLFNKFYSYPFINIANNKGVEIIYISVKSIVYLIILFYVIRYLNRAIHAIWQYVRYTIFMRRHKRTSIRANEINLSLGNSIITVLIWFIYAVIVVTEWRIPTGSLGLVAGGLSAGIGLSLKDIINNFIYGIQLMGGRIRVGDWIECEGVRGRVTAISYQCVQVETIEGTEMSFLNSSLFGKNFNNLTRNNSYELVKIIVGVAYGTDIQKAREVITQAMQTMRTKDRYGREIVDPKNGVYVVVEEMSDSTVDLAVKQYILVAERIPYVDKAKEVVYNALNAAGITIAFPQCDVHLIKD